MANLEIDNPTIKLLEDLHPNSPVREIPKEGTFLCALDPLLKEQGWKEYVVADQSLQERVLYIEPPLQYSVDKIINTAEVVSLGNFKVEGQDNLFRIPPDTIYVRAIRLKEHTNDREYFLASLAWNLFMNSAQSSDLEIQFIKTEISGICLSPSLNRVIVLN